MRTRWKIEIDKVTEPAQEVPVTVSLEEQHNRDVLLRVNGSIWIRFSVSDGMARLISNGPSTAGIETRGYLGDNSG